MNPNRTLPNSLELEQQVLASLLEQPKKAVSEFLSMAPNVRSYFFDIRHQTIFETLVEMVDAGRGVTLASLHQRLTEKEILADAGGLEYVAMLPGFATSLENLKDFTDDLRGLYVKRSLILASNEIELAGHSDDAETALSKSEQALLNIRADNSPTTERTIRDLCRAAIDRFDDAYQNKGKIRGLATGFYDLDQKLRGLKSGQLIVMAARPGMGKTSIVLNIADRVAVDDRIPVGIFSLEMSDDEITSRLVSSRAKVPNDRLELGNLLEGDLPKITAATGKIAGAPFYICDEGGLTIAQLRAKARRMAMRHHVQLLVVDYLQLMRGRRSENRTAEVTEISNGLKALAKELRLPIIALSQLNRDLERDGKREPRLSDLRDSGSVEQDADIVCFLHSTEPEDKDPLPVNLLIRKHRNGPVGKVPLMFFKRWTRFESAARHQEASTE